MREDCEPFDEWQKDLAFAYEFRRHADSTVRDSEMNGCQSVGAGFQVGRELEADESGGGKGKGVGDDISERTVGREQSVLGPSNQTQARTGVIHHC